MSETIPSMVERVAKAICNEVNDQPFDALPETATYLERKTHVDRPMLDKQEARQVARAAIEAIDADDDAFVHAVGELMHDARFSVSGETYPVVRNFIRALKATALNEEG